VDRRRGGAQVCANLGRGRRRPWWPLAAGKAPGARAAIWGGVEGKGELVGEVGRLGEGLYIGGRRGAPAMATATRVPASSAFGSTPGEEREVLGGSRSV
jgi:hypothetical protein